MATKRKVCFTGPTRLKLAEEILRDAGCELVMGKNQDDFRSYKYERRELVDLIGDSAVVFPSGRDIIGGEILDSCDQLQAVVKSSIGIETVDVDAATDLGILCCNSPTPMMPTVRPIISMPRFCGSFQPPWRSKASLYLSRLNSMTISPTVASATPR